MIFSLLSPLSSLFSAYVSPSHFPTAVFVLSGEYSKAYSHSNSAHSVRIFFITINVPDLRLLERIMHAPSASISAREEQREGKREERKQRKVSKFT